MTPTCVRQGPHELLDHFARLNFWTNPEFLVLQDNIGKFSFQIYSLIHGSLLFFSLSTFWTRRVCVRVLALHVHVEFIDSDVCLFLAQCAAAKFGSCRVPAEQKVIWVFFYFVFIFWQSSKGLHKLALFILPSAAVLTLSPASTWKPLILLGLHGVRVGAQTQGYLGIHRSRWPTILAGLYTQFGSRSPNAKGLTWDATRFRLPSQNRGEKLRASSFSWAMHRWQRKRSTLLEHNDSVLTQMLQAKSKILGDYSVGLRKNHKNYFAGKLNEQRKLHAVSKAKSSILERWLKGGPFF